MTEAELRARLAEVEEQIANAKQWGAALSVLYEERQGLLRSLRAYYPKTENK